jgi:hypothetical protein
MKLEIIAVATLLVLSGCNVEHMVSQYEGDGTIEFVKRPAALASDGVVLRFDSFGVSSNFSRKYSLQKLPRLDNRYMLYMTVATPTPLDELKNCIISTRLTDSRGSVLWDVKKPIGTSWLHAERRNQVSVEYYCMSPPAYIPECSFIPEKEQSYSLEVSFTTDQTCSNLTNTASFCLKAGGFK